MTPGSLTCHLRTLSLMVVLVVAPGCATTTREWVEGGAFPKDLAPGPVRTTSASETVYFLKPGESPENWTEMGWLGTYAIRRKTPDEVLRVLIDERRKQCPMTEPRVIARDETSLTYELQIRDCPGAPDRYEIGRIITGKSNVFALVIAAKTRELSDEQRREWIKGFAEATLHSP